MDMGNVNSSYNEDIISTVKKIRFPNGDSYPYISGQAIRRMARERMRDAGFQMSPKDEESGKSKSPYSTQCEPSSYVDDDLFGYMNAKDRITRTSVVRVSPAVALFPYTYDRDLGIQNNSDIHQDHRMYETEVSANWFSYSVLIELDRIGNGKKEIKKGDVFEDWSVSSEERLKRLKGVLESFLYLWGGGKQSRLLTSGTPVAVAISLQTVKNPIWMGKLVVDQSGNLDDDVITRTLEENKQIMARSAIGTDNISVKSSVFRKSPQSSFLEIIENLDPQVFS
jgi:CRISPR-associated protein Cst2